MELMAKRKAKHLEVVTLLMKLDAPSTSPLELTRIKRTVEELENQLDETSLEFEDEVEAIGTDTQLRMEVLNEVTGVEFVSLGRDGLEPYSTVKDW